MTHYLKIAASALALSLSIAALPASAAVLLVSSYDLPNGSGTETGAPVNFHDSTYNGAGNPNSSGAALSGGTGLLTDGVKSTGHWDTATNQYVAWYDGAFGTTNPALNFHLAGSPTVNAVTIWFDNIGNPTLSGRDYSGVTTPGSVLIDGALQLFTPLAGSVGPITFGGLNLTGPSHVIQFFQGEGNFTAISEVQFSGIAAPTPEPEAWASMVVGLGFAGGIARMRRRRTLANA